MAASIAIRSSSLFSIKSSLYPRCMQQIQSFSQNSTNLHSRKLWRPIIQITRNLGRASGKKRSIRPVEELEASGTNGFRSLIKPFGFTVLVSGVSFSGAMVWQYESLRTIFQKLHNHEKFDKQEFFGKAGSFRHHINSWWNTLTPGKKMVAQLIGVNFAVFFLWKVRALQSTMLKYFASSPFTGAPCLSMVLSTFSHYSLFHIGANMFVLWSFSSPITQFLGREQFLAFFFTAGVVSSFTSYVYKAARLSLVPSLGASGVIMAMIGAVCCQYPDARLSIAFVDLVVPHSFSADSAMKALIAFDTLGILFGWRLFDHAAHLGGILFGIWYEKYGRELVWIQYREPVLKLWHSVRGKP